MGLQCGIVGLPNVGKSTIFNALTAAGIAAENYPFCTIEPNSGVVVVPDARLQALDDIDSNLSEVNGVRGCAFCGGLGHRITECPKRDKDARRLNSNRRDMLGGDGYGGDW